MIWIKDPLHGDIEFSEEAARILDHPSMQRLRRISQTGYCNLLYPSANHNRFEHSLGTYHLTKRACDYLDLDEESRRKVSLLGLVHDVGHPCFSHTLEPVLEDFLNKDHEDVMEEKIKKIEDDTGVILTEEIGPEKSIVKGDLGTDRMDYLLRDSFYTGVGHQSIDVDRLLRTMKLKNGKIVFERKALSVVEAMLLTRFLMYPSVYLHRLPTVAEKMVEKMVRQEIEEGFMDVHDLVEWDEFDLVNELRDQNHRLMERIDERRLFKRAFQKRVREFSNWKKLVQLDGTEISDVESKIAERTGLKWDQVYLLIPNPWSSDLEVFFEFDNEVKNISEVSTLSSMLKKAQWDYCLVSLLCPEDKREEVKKEGKKVLKEI